MRAAGAALLAALLALGACGKKAPLEPPPGADPAYPRTYPAEPETSGAR